MSDLQATFAEIIKTMQKEKPQVLYLGKTVAVSECAAMVLAAGGKFDRAADPAVLTKGKAQVLFLDMDGFKGEKEGKFLLQVAEAGAKAVPIVLHLHNCHFSKSATVVAGELLEKKLVQVLSGSVEDLAVLLEGKAGDNLHTEAKKAQLAGLAAKKFQCVCCVNEGPQAFVSDGKREVVLNGGDTLLELLPGLGGVATSLYACCAAATKDMFAATVLGQILLSEGSVLARHFTEKKDGPGTFAVRLIDGVYNIVNHWDVFQMQMKKMQ